MLIYKLYNPDEVANPIKIEDESIPEYLKSEIDKETDNLIKEQLDIEEKMLKLEVKVRRSDSEYKIIPCKKTDTL